MKLANLFLIIYILFSFGCTPRGLLRASSSKHIEEKYSQLLGVKKENILNKKLFSLIDDWYGTPYKYGGKTTNGVDCSGFTIVLYKEVYKKKLTGSALTIHNQCSLISKDELKEGDLVFFKIDSTKISHIGIYLQNNKFVHATTKAGVRIDDLNEEYYRKYFAGGGKVN